MCNIQDSEVEHLLLELKKLDEMIDKIIPELESKVGYRFCIALTEYYSKIHRGISEFAGEMIRTSLSELNRRRNELNYYICSLRKHTSTLEQTLKYSDIIENAKDASETFDQLYIKQLQINENYDAVVRLQKELDDINKKLYSIVSK